MMLEMSFEPSGSEWHGLLGSTPLAHSQQLSRKTSMKVGLVGVGFMGWIHWLAYQRIAGIEVSAICSSDPKKRSGDWTDIQGNFGPPGEKVDLTGCEVFHSLDELLVSDVDIVDICLPPSLHVGASEAAMKAGKHVFCEKPLALNATDCDLLVSTASEYGVKLFVGHVLPYFPEYQYARALIESGTYGKLKGGHFKRIISDPTWLPDFYDRKTVGGPMIDLHVHDAHLIRMLFGMPERVASFGRMRGDVVEFCNSIFDFGESNFTVSATCGVINQQGRPFMHGYEIHLEDATVHFEFAAYSDHPEAAPLKVLVSDGTVVRPELPTGDDVAGFVGEIQEVQRCIVEDTDSAILGGELARDAILLAERQTESVCGGRIVSI
jgi:predicted dehydrogenase